MTPIVLFVMAADECRDVIPVNSALWGYNKQLVFKWPHKGLKEREIRTQTRELGFIAAFTHCCALVNSLPAAHTHCKIHKCTHEDTECAKPAERNELIWQNLNNIGLVQTNRGCQFLNPFSTVILQSTNSLVSF